MKIYNLRNRIDQLEKLHAGALSAKRLRIWEVWGRTDEEMAAGTRAIEAGEIEHPSGGRWSAADAHLFIEVVILPEAAGG